MKIKEYYDEIKKIDGDWEISEFFQPATKEQIFRFEQEKGIKIPDSYKEWLFLSNGAHLFGRTTYLYGVDVSTDFTIGYDFSKGMVPEEYIILGFFGTKHICYSQKINNFFFYEYQNPLNVPNECLLFDRFNDVLEYIIDIETK